MLEVLGMKLTEAHVGVMNEGVPEELKVNFGIDKVTKHDESNVILEFSYNVQYMPDQAVVNVKGVAFARDTPSNIKKLLDSWRSKKEVPSELAGAAINMINANAAINTLFLIRPFNLVPHFMPPPIFTSEETPVPEKQKTKAKPKKTAKKKKKK